MAESANKKCGYCVPCLTLSGNLEIDTVTHLNKAKVRLVSVFTLCKKDIKCTNKRATTKIPCGPFSKPEFIAGTAGPLRGPPMTKVEFGPIKICLEKLPTPFNTSMSTEFIDFTKERVCCSGVQKGLLLRNPPDNPSLPPQWPELEEKCTPCCDIIYELGLWGISESPPGCKSSSFQKNFTIPARTFQAAIRHPDMCINFKSTIWNRLSYIWDEHFFSQSQTTMGTMGLPRNDEGATKTIWELGCGCPPQGKCCS